MNIWLGAASALLMLSTAAAGSAKEITPAWQEPGFVREEIVVTATSEDVAAAARERLHRRARMLVASSMRAISRGGVSQAPTRPELAASVSDSDRAARN